MAGVLCGSPARAQTMIEPVQPLAPDATVAIPAPSPATAPSLSPAEGLMPVSPAAPDGPTFIPSDPAPAALPASTAPTGQTLSSGAYITPVEVESPLMDPTAGSNNSPSPSSLTDNDSAHWVFSVEGGVVYDDNILLSARDQKADTAFTLAPKADYRSGDLKRKRNGYGTFSYSPEAVMFLSESSENAVDHHVLADIQERFGDWLVGMDGGFERLSGATPDLGDRVERSEWKGRLRAAYDFGGDISADTALGFRAVKYAEGNFADYTEWLSETYVGYQINGAFKVSAGAGFGGLDVDSYGKQTFQRALVRVNANPMENLSLEGSGGAEFRQTDSGNDTTPVFRVSANTSPLDGTTVGLEGFREVNASGSQPGQNITRTGAAVQVRQQIGEHLSAGLSAGVETSEYQQAGDCECDPVTGKETSARSDDYFFVRPSVRYEFTEGRRAELYWSFRQDDSSVSDFSFEGNQIGLSVLFDF